VRGGGGRGGGKGGEGGHPLIQVIREIYRYPKKYIEV